MIHAASLCEAQYLAVEGTKCVSNSTAKPRSKFNISSALIQGNFMVLFMRVFVLHVLIILAERVIRAFAPV